jgi:translation initiation factor 2A
MTSSPSTREQYAFRSQKHLGLVSGYDPLQLFDPQDVSAKTYVYSRDGSLYATALPASVRIYTAQDALLLQQVEVPNIVEISFSPLGTYLSTWERPTKLEDGAQHKNFRVWSVKSGEEVLALSQKSQDKWDFQYTSSESHAARVVGPEIVVFYPADWKKGVVDKLRIDNISTISVSPGKNPYVAVFVAEKNVSPPSSSISSTRLHKKKKKR